MQSPDRNLQIGKGLLGHRNVTTKMEYININLEVAGEIFESELSIYIDYIN